MITQSTVTFREEISAKIPALTLLTNLGYQYISPSDCGALRGNPFTTDNKSTHQVVLMGASWRT